MDKQRIAAMFAAVSARVPVAARRGAEAVASRRGAERLAARRTRLAAAQRALLCAHEPSLRAIPEEGGRFSSSRGDSVVTESRARRAETAQT
jgi:hypothetical protein